jgi:hypothetical protein
LFTLRKVDPSVFLREIISEKYQKAGPDEFLDKILYQKVSYSGTQSQV